MQILCVDDEPELLELGKVILENRNEFSVDTAVSASAALEILSKKPYDAIVSDYMMPEIDGIDFLKKVRTWDKTIPFIFFTGKGQEEVAIEALNNGADFYLQKGSTPNSGYMELSQVIRQVIQVRRTQMSFEEQEQRYHDILNTNDLIQTIATDGRFLFVNKKWIDTLGYLEDELRNLTIFDVIHEDNITFFKDTFQQIISGANVGIIDIAFRTHDRRKIWVGGIASCSMEEGKCQYVRGIFRDITARKVAEEQLHLKNIIFESSIAANSIADNQGIIKDVNLSFLSLWGYRTKENAIGKSIDSFFAHENDAVKVTEELDSSGRWEGEFIAKRLDGSTFNVLSTATIIRDVTGKQFGYQFTCLDVTRNKQTEAALHAMISGLVGTTGRESLDQIARSLSTWLGADCVMIGEIMPDKKRVRALSMLLDGKKVMDYSFTLTGTPCENTRKKGFAFYPDRVARLFPKDTTLQEFNIRGYAGTVLRNSKQQVVGILSILSQKPLNLPPSAREIIDIIAIKVAAEMNRVRDLRVLSESEKKFRTLFVNSPYPIVISGIPDNKYLNVNKAFLNAIGYSLEEVLGKNPVELGLMSRKDAEGITARLIRDGRMENVPLVLTLKGGKQIQILYSSMPVTINDKPARVTMIAELSNLKRFEEEILLKSGMLTAMEDELRENYIALLRKDQELSISEHHYRTLFENMPSGFAYCKMIYDESGNPDDYIYLQTNQAFLHLTGLKNFIGKRVTEVIPEIKKMHPELFIIFGRVARTGIPETFEFFSEPMGKWDNITVYGLEKDCFVAIINDITERRRTEEALQQANKKLNLLSGITRHDIRNQLLALSGYLEISREYLTDPNKTSEYIAKEEAIIKTISNQISFTKDYQEMGVKAPTWQNISGIINTVITRLPLRDIHVDAGDLTLEVFADPLLEKVFYNLIDNALRYGGEMMTLIRLTNREDAGGLIISVEDDGSGISAEDKEKLFTKGFGRNTGLGLYLSREILSITGNTITEHGEPGKGARFEIFVPKGQYRSSTIQ
jgi:PAS domain S-box-containing protein